MATVKLLSDDELSQEARIAFDDIRKTRQPDFVNNFWRALAHDRKTLGRTWESVKQVGVLEPKVKEMLYVAVSIAHGCTYCIHSHTASARAKGMTDQEYAEMIANVGRNRSAAVSGFFRLASRRRLLLQVGRRSGVFAAGPPATSSSAPRAAMAST